MAEMQEGRVMGSELETSAGMIGMGREERAAQGLPPVHLLVVDDDEHVRGVCRSIAEESGMKVFDGSTAEEALEILVETKMGRGLFHCVCQKSNGKLIASSNR